MPAKPSPLATTTAGAAGHVDSPAVTGDAGLDVIERQHLAKVAGATYLLWAFFGSAILAGLYGRVALLNLSTGVVGGANDGYQNLWNNWWVKTALLDLHTNPFFSDYIYYPTGTSLRFHTLNPINGVFTLPLNLTVGYVPAINVLFLVSLLLTHFCTFLLFRYLVRNSWAAFAASAAAVYANFRVIGFLSAGQAEKLSGEWLPLYLLLMLHSVNDVTGWHVPRSHTVRTSQGGAGGVAELQVDRDNPATRGKGWLISAGGAVAVLLIMSLTDWQYVMYAVFVTLLLFAFVFVTRRTRQEKLVLFGRLAVIGGSYALLATPTLLLPMVREALESPWLSISYQSQVHALDLLDFIGPGLYNPGYLTLVVAGLGLWAAWHSRSRSREIALFWGLVALIFYVFALGPELTFKQQPTGIPLPYALITDLPVFSTGRDPGRFNIPALLGVGVLVAFGLRAIIERLHLWSVKRQVHGANHSPVGGIAAPRGLLAGVLPAGVVALFVAITLSGFIAASGEVKAVPPEWPPFYRQLAEDPESYAILELPLFSDAGKGAEHYMAYQVVHGKPRFSGRIARDRKLTNPNNFVKNASLFRHLWAVNLGRERLAQAFPDWDILDRTDYRTQGIPILNYLKVRYVILYREALTADETDQFESLIGAILGAEVKPYYEDAQMRVYRVPENDAGTSASTLTFDVGDGWYPAEMRSDGVVFRLADRTNYDLAGQPNTVPAELLSMNLHTEPVRATLQFTAYAYKQPRTLQALINGYELGTYQLNPDNPTTVSLEVTLPTGHNIITFASPEDPLPTDNPAQDARLLSFGMYGVGLSTTAQVQSQSSK